MCLYPKLIRNRKYTKTKKNGGNIPQAADKRVLLVPVGCGKCMECTKQKARQWQVRLQEEIRQAKNGQFVTLTFKPQALEELTEAIQERGYKNELTGYELENEIATLATRRFLERWRKKHKRSVRHWLVTELGQTSTERIHIHGIIWTDNKADISKIWNYGKTTIGEQKWENGIMTQGGQAYVNEATINYIVKYISKTDKLHKEYQSKILTSAGIGNNYTKRLDSKNNKYNKKKTNETYQTRQGTKINLPIYYRNKIYTEEEKEKLWLEKLDKQERWVDGVKIDVSNGEEHYYQALYRAREKNQRLGYGNDSYNWERKRYENERRAINKLKKCKGNNKGD